jgi:hypothetical protein
MRRTLQSLGVLALLALLGAGCGSNAPSETGTAGASTARQTGMKFADCMRDNGVSAFPDPDASGELTIDAVANGSSLDMDSAAFKQAISACKDLQPSGFTGGKRSSQKQASALKFAQCIRENGVTDFPDPVNGEPLVNTYKIPSSNEPGGMTILNAAMRKCGAKYARKLALEGKG